MGWRGVLGGEPILWLDSALGPTGSAPQSSPSRTVFRCQSQVEVVTWVSDQPAVGPTFPQPSPLGLVSLLQWLTELGKTVYLLAYWFIIKATAQERPFWVRPLPHACTCSAAHKFPEPCLRCEGVIDASLAIGNGFTLQPLSPPLQLRGIGLNVPTSTEPLRFSKSHLFFKK